MGKCLNTCVFTAVGTQILFLVCLFLTILSSGFNVPDTSYDPTGLVSALLDIVVREIFANVFENVFETKTTKNKNTALLYIFRY